jgi:fatty acid-binding protein DegV
VKQKSSVFIHPRGFIEQHYHDGQTPESSLHAIKQLEKSIDKVQAQNKPVLIYIDVSKLKKIDLSRKMLHVRMRAAKAMKDLDFDKAAVCAPLPVQVLVTTLALVAGKSKKVRAFDHRAQAVKWLVE